MRRFYVKRKDLSHFPFQFYIDRNGIEQPLPKGYTFTFAIEPPKDPFPFLHVHIFQDFALELDRRWEIPQANFIQVAAKAFEAWLQGEPIPEDHFNNSDMLMVDAEWYPHDPNGAPMLAVNPYYFEVDTNEPWSPLADLENKTTVSNSIQNMETVDAAVNHREKKKFVFGFTIDVCPSSLFIGYEQLRNRAMQANLDVELKLCRLNELPPDTDTLFVPSELQAQAQQAAPSSRIIVLQDLINNPIYNELVQHHPS